MRNRYPNFQTFPDKKLHWHIKIQTFPDISRCFQKKLKKLSFSRLFQNGGNPEKSELQYISLWNYRTSVSRKLQLNISIFDWVIAGKPSFQEILVCFGHAQETRSCQSDKILDYWPQQNDIKMSLKFQLNSIHFDKLMATKLQFWAIWAYFGPKKNNFGKRGILGKIQDVPLVSPYSALTSYKKLEKSLEHFSKEMGITLLLGPN